MQRIKTGAMMKFKQYLAFISSDPNGFIPTPHMRQIIRKNDRPTVREEAILGKLIESADPRHNITGHYGWNQEEQLVLQQLWIREAPVASEWRDVPTEGADELYTTTEEGIPVPNAVNQPEVLHMDINERLREILG